MTKTQEPADTSTAGALVPPRPNLGPEPWPIHPNSFGGTIPVTLLVLLVVGLGLRVRRGKRRKPREESSPLVESSQGDPSPREQLIATSNQIRNALFQAFGPSWRSKTTEEIGNDRSLIERLDPDDFGRLITFLILADRAKFAGSEPESLDDWTTWAAGFSARLRTREARETMKK